jgi:hypothetical protein
MLTSKGDEFYENLYNISWNSLSISDQKSLQIIILYAKKPKGLAAGITTLDFGTFMEVCVYFLNA